MQINISGSPSFKNLIKNYHSSLLSLALQEFPEFSNLKNICISVKETSTLSDLGLSRFDHKELLINHQLTYNNPKLLLEVYGHELAHFLVTYSLQKNVQHGPEWQKVMRAMNLPAREVVSFSQNALSKMSIVTIKCECMFGHTKKVPQSRWNPEDPCKVCHKKFNLI